MEQPTKSGEQIMEKVVARKLKPWEAQKLKRMKRQLSNAVNCRHARIILLSRGGCTNQHIAECCGCTPTWVRQIIHRFNRGGLEAITWYPYYCTRAGPRKFFSDIVEQIGEVALSSPKHLIGMSVWSLEKLRAYLVEQKMVSSISLEWLRQLLRRHRIRWRHTKTWKDSDDPQFWPKYRRIRRLYGKRPEGGRRLCIDEFGPLNLQPRHGKHYARIGHVNRHRATYSRTGGVRHMLGAYDMERDTLVGIFVVQKNWISFLAFLKQLRRSYRRGEVLHIVLDNAGYHLKAEVLDYAATHKIKFYWTPTNASWLNRIESHFTALRKFALDDTDYRSHLEQQEAIESYLSWRNRSRDISVEEWKSYRRAQKKVA
jgi:transposase